MSRKAPFLNKLLARLDKIDRDALQTYMRTLAREHELYHEILETLPLGLALLDESTQVQFINAQGRTYLGCEMGRLAAGMSLQELAQDHALRSFFVNHPLKPGHQYTEDIRVLLPRELDLRVQVMPLDKAGAGAWLVLLFNLSHEKSKEQEKSAWSSRESLLKLAAGVAHEIGNPLNSIQIHLGLLKRDAEDLPSSKQKNFLKTLSVLQSETTRLDRIVRAFLKATRKPPLRFRLSDLNEVIQESVDFFHLELQARNVKLHFRSDKGLRPFLMDKERLREVFLNLIKNAMEAMPEGGAVRISVTHRAKAAFVRVRDEGPGIPDEVLPHIFEAYYTTKPEGSGLGLVSVYNAVAEHGGRLEVETRHGKGTTFTLMLPLREPRLQISSEDASTRDRKNDRNPEGS